MRSLALHYISIPCFAFLRKYTLYPTCRLLLIDLPRTADYNYKASISSSGPLPVQESWNHMQDLKHVFSYLKPYRRDLFLAVGLVFVECIFEMVIPMLMSDLVDQGVPSHDMQVIMLQGSKMIICAVLACCTPGSPPALLTALPLLCAKLSTASCSSSTLPTWTIFPPRPSLPA